MEFRLRQTVPPNGPSSTLQRARRSGIRSCKDYLRLPSEPIASLDICIAPLLLHKSADVLGRSCSVPTELDALIHLVARALPWISTVAVIPAARTTSGGTS